MCVWVGACVWWWVHWWLSGIHSELPIKGLGVQGQPPVDSAVNEYLECIPGGQSNWQFPHITCVPSGTSGVHTTC